VDAPLLQVGPVLRFRGLRTVKTFRARVYSPAPDVTIKEACGDGRHFPARGLNPISKYPRSTSLLTA
jgi:hypothetical protein